MYLGRDLVCNHTLEPRSSLSLKFIRIFSVVLLLYYIFIDSKMPNKCCIPGCKTGLSNDRKLYKNEGKKYPSLFHPPEVRVL